jgi:hypothetical protein
MQESGFFHKLRSALREPLVHFLLLGTAIYAVAAWTGPEVEAEDDNRIVVTAGEIGWLTSSWEKRWNRPPTPQERQGLIDQYIRETVFYREALAMGLDRDDTIIRRRLAQKLEFLTQDLVATVPPTEEELRAYFTEHAARYQQPALVTFTHVFIDPDRHGEQSHPHAKEIGAKLRALSPPTDGAAALGDPFMLQAYYPERTEAEVAKLFGTEFARSVAGLVPGAWHGPVLSGYGMHFVYVDRRSPVVPAEFVAVRDRVEQDWRDARREEFEAEYYAALRARYEVVVEDPDTSGDTVALSAAP